MEPAASEEYTVKLFPAREKSSPCAVILRGEHDRDRAEDTVSLIESGLEEAGRQASLCFVGVSDWDRQLSPWSARGSDQSFAGEGEATLSFLEKDVIPTLCRELGDVPFVIGGYSLAGLFSLWAYLTSPVFSAAASCSGSLWFPGFEAMARQTPLREGSLIYLSLGGKESSTPDPLMATVGEVHERLYRRFRSDPAVRSCRYDRNPGGHFREPDRRLAKGIVWAVENVR
ncbi:MAG: hypothetical protein J5822_06185 [Eubacteriaceae bacterium]|nr:hypothetical protein [Eubacteriaceae bacterium]